MKQREIKFRVWQYDIIRENFTMLKWERLQGCSVQYFTDNNAFPDRVVMQFIECIDKNGTEIYDGDLVRDTSGNVGRIAWSGYGWVVEFEGITQDPEYIEEWGEVIGNVFQNPELIQP